MKNLHKKLRQTQKKRDRLKAKLAKVIECQAVDVDSNTNGATTQYRVEHSMEWKSFHERYGLVYINEDVLKCLLVLGARLSWLIDAISLRAAMQDGLRYPVGVYKLYFICKNLDAEKCHS